MSGRRGQIKEPVPVQLVRAVEFLEPVLQFLKCFRMVIFARNIGQGLAQIPCTPHPAACRRRANFFTESTADFWNASSVIGVRANPMMANRRARQFCAARPYSAGTSFRRERSPEAPKMTMVQGSAGEIELCFAGSAVSASLRFCLASCSGPHFFAAALMAWPPNWFRIAASSLSE